MPPTVLPEVSGALKDRDPLRATAIIASAIDARRAPPWAIANSILAVAAAGAPDTLDSVMAAARTAMPEAGAVLIVHSEIEAGRGRLDSAIALARSAMDAPDQRGMGGGRACIMLARHLHASGRHEEALAVMAAPLAADPPVATFFAMAATIRAALGQFAEASALAARHARLIRTHGAAWLHALRLALRAGQPELAVLLGQEAREAIGPNPHIAREWAGALHGCGRFGEAADVAAEGLARLPGNFHLHRQRVLSFVAAGRLDDAAEAGLDMVRGTSINAEVTFTLSVFLRAMPDAAARSAFIDRAIAANPHPRIRSMQAGVQPPGPDATVVARDRSAFATELFAPDDLIPELAGHFAGAPYQFARQLQTWARNRLERGAKPSPISAFTVPDATVLLRDGMFIIHGADGEAVDLTAQRPNAALMAEAAAAPIVGEIGPVFLVNNMGMRNYAHWCLDILPQLAIGATQYPEARLVVQELAERRFMRQTLAEYGFDPAILTSLPAGRYRTSSVTLLSASVTPTFRHALQFGNRAYARHLLDRSRPGPSRDRRLYIDRPPSQRRTVVNRVEFAALLDRHGFETLDPGTLPVAQQAELFRQASHIVGLHGAALANLMHCRAGTRVLEVHSPDHTTTAFAITALVRECAYRAHIGQSIASDGRLWAHPQDMDFRVDVQALEQDLAWLLQ